MKKSNSQKYLEQYAEAEVNLLHTFPRELSLQHVVLVPAFKEDSNFISTFLANSFQNKSALMVLVINQPESFEDENKQRDLHNALNALGMIEWQQKHLSLLSFLNTDNKILIIDRYSSIKIPDKFGVGLARKIGADIALALHELGAIQSDWICSTDADATLPISYFSSVSNLHHSNMAACFNFSHYCENEEVNQANALYERALRYYVAGLEYAGSPYAFYTIGSTLAFNAAAYANVRGFPKRSAGEDFYLLNKLAKLGSIEFIEDSVINIIARESDRVPFGTGPAVSNIIAKTRDSQAYYYYHPSVFEALKHCLSSFKSLYQQRFEIKNWLSEKPSHVATALQNIGFNQFIAKNKSHTELQFNKQLNVWFDAFKTLKFIHEVRDLKYANIPLVDAIDMASFNC